MSRRSHNFPNDVVVIDNVEPLSTGRCFKPNLRPRKDASQFFPKLYPLVLRPSFRLNIKVFLNSLAIGQGDGTFKPIC